MPSLHRPPRLSLLLAFALAACGGGDGGTTPTPIPAGFTVALSSTTLSVEQGGNGSVTATIARTGSFAGTVNLSVEALPTGITASFNPAAITAGTTQTTLTVTAAASVAPGSYNFTIRGQAAGVNDQRTATVAVTVTARPAIAMTLSSATSTAQQGANATFTATIARTNFTGAVAVAITGANAITPTVTNVGDVYTITLAVNPLALIGPQTLTVTATGTGVTAATATHTITVTAAPPASITVAASPTAITMQAGSAAQDVTLTITRVNFTGTVVTAVQSGLVTGLTATVSPTGPQQGNTATVSFQAGVNTAPGTYNVVVQSAGAGATAGTVTIAVTVTAAPASSISLTALPASLVVTAGSGNAATTTVTITRNNFAGAVAIASSGAPAGVTVTPTPASTAANTSSVAITADGSVAAGMYPITITGSGTGIANASVVVNLTVNVVPASISLSLSPASLSLQTGASGTSTVTIARTNYTGSVTIAATGQPAGITITPTGSPTTGNTVTLNVGVGANVAAGTYPVTITGSGTGITNATTTLNITVPQPSSGGNVTWQFCALTGIPIWVAAQNGNAGSPWVRVTAGSNNTFSFDITTVGAIAFVSQSGSSYTLTVVYGTRAELNAQGTGGACVGSPTGKTVTGTVAGLTSALEFASLTMAGAAASAQQAMPTFTLNNVPDGNRDLLATRSVLNLTTGSLAVNKAIIRRNLNPPNNSSLGTIDFGGSEAFDPVNKQLTIAGGAGGSEILSAFNYLYTSNGTFGLLGLGFLAGTVYDVPTVPLARTVAGDVNVITAIGTTFTGGDPSAIRSTFASYRDPANQTLTLGPQLNVPTISVVSTTGYARLRSMVARQSEYDNSWQAIFSQSIGASNRQASLQVLPGYMGSSTNFDVTIPDFTGVAGWLDTWGPQTGTETSWNVSMTGWINLTGLFTDGSVFRTAQRLGSVTP